MDAPLSVAVAAMLTRSGIDVAALPRVANRGNAGDLLDGKADMMVAYSTNEPFAFERVGRPYRAFSPRAVGVDFYGDTLFTTERELHDRPERAAALRAASLRGWQYAMQHPAEMVESILARHGGNREHLLFEAQEMERLMQPELVPLGEMNPERWRRIAQVFAEAGLLPPGFDVTPLLYRPEGTVIPAGLLWGMAALGVAVLLSTLAVLRMARLRARAGFSRAEPVVRPVWVLPVSGPAWPASASPPPVRRQRGRLLPSPRPRGGPSRPPRRSACATRPRRSRRTGQDR